MWKKIFFITFNLLLAVYLVLAMMAFNKPDETTVCKDVDISFEQGIVEGFLTTDDVKQLMALEHISPIGQTMESVNLRTIEETLEGNELIVKAECYKTQKGTVSITVTQRIPVIRVINEQGEDYYVDNRGKAMPHFNYSCNLIVATGHISKHYSEKVLAPLANLILEDPFWRSQIVQLNIQEDGSVELVPRVGGHIAYLGKPTGISQKLDRLRKFYRYGLSQVGWNKYSRISVEFDNQIICKRK